MTVQEIRDHYERHGLRALSASQVEWLLDAAGGSAGTGAADDSPNSLQPRIAALRARNFQRINDPHAAGTGAAPPEECYNCKRIPDGPFSSANPRMTICRDCWVAAQPPTSAPCGDFHNHLCERCGEMWPAGSGVPREETKP